MKKSVLFDEKDVELIQKVEVYAKEKNISFDEAVKNLCIIAIDRQIWGTF